MGGWWWYLGMLVIPRDAGGGTQGCWQWYPAALELLVRRRGGDLVLFPLPGFFLRA